MLVNDWQPQSDGTLKDTVSLALATVSRTGPKTVTNAITGVITDVADNKLAVRARLDLSTAYEMFIEESRTNYCPYSDFETDANSDGVADGWTKSVTGGIAPTFAVVTGGAHGTKSQRVQYTGVVGDVGRSATLINTDMITGFSGGEVVYGSVSIKGTLNGCQANIYMVAYDVNNNLLGNSTATNATPDASNWTRIINSYTLPANTVAVKIVLRVNAIDSIDSFDIFWDSAQIEKGTCATSYIPTTGATSATRNADVVTVPTTGWNKDQGTIFTVVSDPGEIPPVSRRVFDWQYNSANRISQYRNSSTYGGLYAYTISGNSVSYGYNTKTTPGYSSGVMVWKAGISTIGMLNGTVGSLNGAPLNAFGVTMPDTAQIGANKGGADGYFNGAFCRMVVYDEALANNQLYTLSRIYQNQAFSISTLSAPSPSVSLVAGGALTVGTTYYYKIVAMNASGASAFTYFSPPSIEISVTPTTGNQTARITWPAIPGANAYKVFRTTVPGNYSTDTTHYVRAGASQYYSTTTTSFDDTGSLTVLKDPLIEEGWPLIRGWGGDAVNCLTPDDYATMLINAGLSANVKRDYFSGYQGKPSYVKILGTVEAGITSAGANHNTYFKIPPGSTFIVEGRLRTYTLNNLYMGEKLAGASGSGNYGRNGSVLVMKSVTYTGGNMSSLFGKAFIYDSHVKCIDSSIANMYSNDDNFTLSNMGAGSEILQSFFSQIGGNTVFSGALGISNSIMYAPGWFESAGNGTPSLSNVLWTPKTWAIMAFNAGTSSVSVRDLNLVSMSDYGAEISFHRQSGNLTENLYDPIFLGYLPLGKAGSNGQLITINIYRSVIASKIRKPDKTALQGATVSLKRSDGTPVFSLTTDSNGQFTSQDVLTMILVGKAGVASGTIGTTTVYDLTDYNDFVLTIEAPGYETISKAITLDRKEYIDETMVASVTTVIDDSGRTYRKRNYKNTGSISSRRELTR